MKKLLMFICTVTLFFAVIGNAYATLITNGYFDDGLDGWTYSGDVTIGNTNDQGGKFASAQGMVGNYALLGLDTTDGKSTLRQDFDVTGLNSLTLSFNWAFDYWDNSCTADDTFLSFVRQDGTPAYRISLLDLTTNGTPLSWDLGTAYGYYSETIDISSYTTEDARLIFRLIEESDSSFWTGTGSVAGIDNIVVSPAPVPEPSTMLLLGAGLLGLAGFNRKRFTKKS